MMPLAGVDSAGWSGMALQGVQSAARDERPGAGAAERSPARQPDRLPEDTVSLSGQRPQQADGAKTEGKPDRLAGDTAATGAGADDTAVAGDRVAAGGKEVADPQLQQQIAQLKATEEKVKAHEAAHKAAGGNLAGSVSYSYTRGPDGRSYITGGEVQIDLSDGQTPRETASRMQQVIRAALAPADPSSQDRAVAAQAAGRLAEAQQEAAAESTATSGPAADETARVAAVSGGDNETAGRARQAYGDPAVQGSAASFGLHGNDSAGQTSAARRRRAELPAPPLSSYA